MHLFSVLPSAFRRPAAPRFGLPIGLPMAIFLLALLVIGHALPVHASAVPGNTYYVALTGSDSSPGTAAQPFLTIQYGINSSVSGDTVIVEDGTYTGLGDVDLDFGGRNITVTSQNGAASTVIDCQGSADANHRGFNFHSGETGAVIRGFTVEDGHENASDGGGIYISGSTVTVENCVLLDNTATGDGGGIFLDNATGTSAIVHCTFTYNYSGSSGGGLWNDTFGSSTILVTDCTFTSNAAQYGGGIDNLNDKSGRIAVTNSAFADNSASANGYGYGGGLYNENEGSGPITVTGCTVIGNSADGGAGGGIYDYSPSNGGPIQVTNTILSGDTGGEISDDPGMVVPSMVTYCDIQANGDDPANHNIDADPLFVDAANGDYHLLPGSPCVGKGTSSAPGYLPYALDNQPRPNPPSIGAFEVKAARLVLTNIAVSRNGGIVTVTATVQNYGNADAGAVRITQAKLAGVAATAPLPGPYTIAAGGSQPISLRFTTNAVGRQPLSIQGTSKGPSFSAGQFLTIP